MNRWRVLRLKVLTAGLFLLLFFLNGGLPAGRGPGGAASKAAPVDLCSSATAAPLAATSDPYGTPSGSSLGCTGAPIRPCVQ